MADRHTIQVLRKPPVWPAAEPLEALACFGADYPAFGGHFPGHPILPAFAQVQLAVDVLHEAFPTMGALCEVRQAKFVRPIGPGESVRIRLAAGPAGAICGTLHVGDELAASFEIVLEAATACTLHKS
jgi:3-hydroxyacyl-[acyl-carrier-protein] dehydratase